ncbi:hypothetical protein COS64_04760 [archaeon CG06_land_8_20_14_3_00_37_11]|nr:MAG: hypothetical protein COS64_04760 [archaeon CG06_land_8_20_14_3_00_37_11]
MNKKLIGGLVLLSLLAMIPLAKANEGYVSFNVTIVVDTTISVPSLTECGGVQTGVLEFTPGIDPLISNNTRPIDGCGDETTAGDYSVINNGNVPIDLMFKVDSAPTGITATIGIQKAYNESYFNLTTSDYTPTWAQNINPATGSDVVQIWQRVGADDTALGGTEQQIQITITSLKSP